MKTVYVVRDKWLRGDSGTNSYLIRREDKKMCCLGFVCRAAKLKVKDLLDVSEPNMIDKTRVKLRWELPEWAMWLVEKPEIVGLMMTENDSEGISEFEREQRLIKLFAEVDVELEFI